MILQRRKLGYDLRKGDAVLNNFELRKMSGREPEEEDEEVTNCTYDKKSDEGSNSVRMRPENSGALKVVKK